MKKIWLWAVAIILFFTFYLLHPAYASTCPTDDPCRDRRDAFDKVNCYTDIVNICSSQRESMTAQVVYLSSKISLTSAKIESHKEKIVTLTQEIEKLTEKIDNLEKTLTKTADVLLNRIVATYKYGELPYFDLLLTSRKFSEFIARFKYIQTSQAHDRRILFQLQNSKINFEDQKILREEKKKELDQLQKQLEKEESNLKIQKREKEAFLEITRNNEAIYKQNLAAAQRESQNIQQAASILSTAGVARRVSKGEAIGVMGNTGFSTGPHLHFSVYNLKESELNKFNFESGYENPFNLLKSRRLAFVRNSCDEVGETQQKKVGSGSWDWPMSNPTITQCFGHTPVSNAYYRSGIHNGLDMYDDINTLIKAVDSGNAYTYRGGQAAGNGVFVFHDNGKMTLFWHLQ